MRVFGDVGRDKQAWLFVCKKPLLSSAQNFRDLIWYEKKHPCVARHRQKLEVGAMPLPDGAWNDYSYVQVQLGREVMQRSYIYIDYPREVKDGGYYYSVDLATWLDGEWAKKRSLEWGRTSDKSR